MCTKQSLKYKKQKLTDLKGIDKSKIIHSDFNILLLGNDKISQKISKDTEDLNNTANPTEPN